MPIGSCWQTHVPFGYSHDKSRVVHVERDSGGV
jgi:hypothetical protein